MTAEHWAVIPAAGVGSRFGAPEPKQYSRLNDRTMIEWAIAPFLDMPWFDGVVVALAADDRRFSQLTVASDPRVHVVTGGATRDRSVLSALDWILARCGGAACPMAWVHDAARPCLAASLLEQLADAAEPDGALLGLPVTDTVKRGSEDQRVEETIPRETLWRAQTPQVFDCAALAAAIRRCHDECVNITDDSQAMEHSGARPRIVLGDSANLKVTVAQDVALAEHWLQSHHSGCRAS